MMSTRSCAVSASSVFYHLDVKIDVIAKQESKVIVAKAERRGSLAKTLSFVIGCSLSPGSSPSPIPLASQSVVKVVKVIQTEEKR